MNHGLMIIVAGLLAWPLQSMASGVLKLSSVELRFAPDEPQGELYAHNIGDTPLYLDVEQTLVLNPGAISERSMAISEVARPTLLITPSRLVLAPGQKYRMNLKVLSMPTRNQVWRVTFRPRQRVIVQGRGAEGQSAPLSVSVGYGVVIYQRAAHRPARFQQE
ncbi:hypothetical protein [Pseudomonas sp.]|uniref:hypothetical protein n=1 Tax=Pseudomonas sp. TaxID=306 RepID=UPI002633EEA9|nr:hypothetical protein [Pseudomonas sp.]